MAERFRPAREMRATTLPPTFAPRKQPARQPDIKFAIVSRQAPRREHYQPTSLAVGLLLTIGLGSGCYLHRTSLVAMLLAAPDVFDVHAISLSPWVQHFRDLMWLNAYNQPFDQTFSLTTWLLALWIIAIVCYTTIRSIPGITNAILDAYAPIMDIVRTTLNVIAMLLALPRGLLPVIFHTCRNAGLLLLRCLCRNAILLLSLCAKLLLDLLLRMLIATVLLGIWIVCSVGANALGRWLWLETVVREQE